MFAQCLGNLAAAGIMSTDKGNLCFNAQFLPLPFDTLRPSPSPHIEKPRYKYYIYHIEYCQPSLFETSSGGWRTTHNSSQFQTGYRIGINVLFFLNRVSTIADFIAPIKWHENCYSLFM